MRAIFLCIAVTSIFPGLSAGDGPPGVPPRPSPSDYPVRQSTKSATIAASMLRSRT